MMAIVTGAGAVGIGSNRCPTGSVSEIDLPGFSYHSFYNNIPNHHDETTSSKHLIYILDLWMERNCQSLQSKYLNTLISIYMIYNLTRSTTSNR